MVASSNRCEIATHSWLQTHVTETKRLEAQSAQSAAQPNHHHPHPTTSRTHLRQQVVSVPAAARAVLADSRVQVVARDVGGEGRRRAGAVAAAGQPRAREEAATAGVGLAGGGLGGLGLGCRYWVLGFKV